MKHVKQLCNVMINKNDEEYKKYFTDGVKNIWSLFINEGKGISPEKHNNITTFGYSINIIPIGIVTQYENNDFECVLIKNDFQSEYEEEELKSIIISDIKEEYEDVLIPDYLISDINILSIFWDKLSRETRDLLINIIRIRYGVHAETKLILLADMSAQDMMKAFIQFEQRIGEYIQLIKDLDDAMTNLKKTTKEKDDKE